ncbi:MAG: PAS domain S-box protein [Candidatus Heimdallarchaeota archaeon]
MSTPLRFLHLEDNQYDADLVKEILELSEIDCKIIHVDNRDDFVSELKKGGINAILADYNLPSFDGLEALKIARNENPELPFIFISGVLGEELAIETLKRGATDYVIKSRIERLVPAVKRALREKEEHTQRIRLEREIIELEQMKGELETTYLQLTKRVRGFLRIELPSGKYTLVDQFLEDLSGYDIIDWKTKTNFILNIIHPDYQDYYSVRFKQMNEGIVPRMLEYKIIRKNGEERWWLQFNIGAFDVDGKLTSISAVIIDNTDDKLAQLKYQNLFENALVGMYRSDVETGELVEANERMSEIFRSASIKELKSSNAKDFYLDEETRLNLIKELQEKGFYEDRQFQVKRRDGTIGWVSESSRIYKDEGYLEGMILDITDRKSAEDAIKRDREAFQLIAEATIHSNNITELSQKILDGLVKTLGFDAGTVRLFDPLDNLLYPIAISGATEEEKAGLPAVPINHETHIGALVARTHEAIFAPDVLQNNALKDSTGLLESISVRANITYPILSPDEELLGVLQLVAVTPKIIPETDKVFFETIADLFTSAIIHQRSISDLHKSEEKFKALVEQTLIGVAIISAGEFLFVNDELANIFEMTTDEVYSSKLDNIISQVLSENDLLDLRKKTSKMLADLQPINNDYLIILPSGRKKWLSFYASPMVIDGEYLSSGIIFLDITEQKRAEMTLERERQAFRIIANATLQAINIPDLCNRILSGLVNILEFDIGTFRLYDKNERMLIPLAAVMKDEAQSRRIVPLSIDDKTYLNTHVARTKEPVFAPDVTKNKIAKKYIKRLESFQAKANLTWPILNANGDLLGTLQIVANQPKELADADKFFFETIVQFFATALERKWAEEEQKRLSSIIEQSDQVIISADPTGNIAYVNPAFVKVFGYTEKESIGQPISLIAPPNTEKQQAKLFQRVKKEGSLTTEVIRKRKDGTLFTMLMNLSLNKNDLGKIDFVNAFFVDITDLKSLESSLRSKYHEFEVLNRIIFAGYKAKNLNQFLDFTLDAILNSFDFTGGAIFLIDRETNTSELKRSLGMPADFTSRLKGIPISSPQFKRLLVNGETLIFDSFSEIEEQHKDMGITFLMSVPFKSKDVIIGALMLISKEKITLTEEDSQLIEAMSRDVGTALAKFVAEDELQRGKNNLQLIFDVITDMMLVVEVDTGKILNANKAVADCLGFTKDELFHKDLRELHPKKKQSKYEKLVSKILSGDVAKSEMVLLGKGGDEFLCEVTIHKEVYDNRPALIVLIKHLEK